MLTGLRRRTQLAKVFDGFYFLSGHLFLDNLYEAGPLQRHLWWGSVAPMELILLATLDFMLHPHMVYEWPF